MLLRSYVKLSSDNLTKNFMSLFLHYRLHRLSEKVKPSQEFLTSLEAKLFPREQILSMHRLRVLRFAVVPALLVISLLGSTTAYAYASDTVLPDHVLYPLRKGVEGVQLQVASVTNMKDRVRLRLLERHAREKRLLQEQQAKKKAKPPVKVPTRRANVIIYPMAT